MSNMTNVRQAKESLDFLSRNLPQKIARLIELELGRVKFCTYRLAPDFSNFAKQLSDFNKNSNFYFKLNDGTIQLAYEDSSGIIHYVDMPDIFFNDFDSFLKQNKQEIENNNVLEFRKYKEFKEARVRDEMRKEQEEFQTYLRLKAKYERY